MPAPIILRIKGNWVLWENLQPETLKHWNPENLNPCNRYT